MSRNVCTIDCYPIYIVCTHSSARSLTLCRVMSTICSHLRLNTFVNKTRMSCGKIAAYWAGNPFFDVSYVSLFFLSSTEGAKDDDGGSSVKSGLGSLSGGSSGLSKKQRKARTAFTDHQLQTLEKSFERQKYLSVQDRMELANKLGLSDTQVKTWYQNRR